VTFGGYGEHTYKSRVNVISPDGGWTTIDPAPGLPPRYLSGMAVMPDGGVIVAGGYGNASGLQSEFPHNFYDIRRLDPLTGRADSLVSIVREKGDEHFVPGRDMVPSDDGKTIYALVYSDKHYASSLQLAGIDLATGRMVRYADEVPYQFSDIESFCTLAFDRVRQEFLMVTMRQQKGEGTLVEIFSLGAPPLCGTDTIRAAGGESAWWWIVLGAAAVAGVAGAVFALARRRRPAMPLPVTAYKAVHEVRDENKSYTTEKRPSSILLLGGFQVVDRAGDDITGQFTQTLRALLLLILLETCKSGRGISSQALGDILWLDKDPENARNNRNVNIHKLRTLLAKVGTAHVSSKSSYWKLELGPDVFCDYAALLATGRELQRRQGDPEVIESLVALASLGKLLPCTQTEWSDGYKADFSARLIEQLMEAASRPEVEANPALSLRIADAILTHDSLDEDAMRLKCGALVKMGKKNQAKQEYNLFVAEFKKALDTAPDFNFSDTL
jgi:two-component SAPR family response regulator